MAKITQHFRKPATGSVAVAVPAPRAKRIRAAGKKERHLTQASGEQCFWVNHGPVLANATDLYYALKDMSDEQFAYHTKRDGNDFAAWVRDVLDEKTLATKLARARSKKGMITALENFLG